MLAENPDLKGILTESEQRDPLISTMKNSHNNLQVNDLSSEPASLRNTADFIPVQEFENLKNLTFQIEKEAQATI